MEFNDEGFISLKLGTLDAQIKIKYLKEAIKKTEEEQEKLLYEKIKNIKFCNSFEEFKNMFSK